MASLDLCTSAFRLSPIHGEPTRSHTLLLSSAPRRSSVPRSQGVSLLPTTWRSTRSLHAFPGSAGGSESNTVCRGLASGQVDSVPCDQESLLLIGRVKEILALENSDLQVGPHGRDDDAMIWWFLRDRKMDVEETVTKLSKAIRWRHEFGVSSITYGDIVEEAATGKAFLHSHADVAGRPVIVVAAAKHFPNPERLKASKELCVYLIEQALERLPPGEEQFLGIFDLRGFSARNADLTFVGFLIQVFFNYYPRRLHRVLFVDAPPIFQPGWKVMRPMLKSYASLVEFCSASDVVEKHFEPGNAPALFINES